MKKVCEYQQKAIDNCEDLEQVIDEELIGWSLKRNVYYTFTFKGKLHSFKLIDSGKSDEPQYGNYDEVSNLKEIQ